MAPERAKQERLGSFGKQALAMGSSTIDPSMPAALRLKAAWWAGLWLLVGAAASGGGQPYQDDTLWRLEQEAFRQAVALVSPSVVRIETVGGLDRLGRFLTTSGPTTGLVVSEDGYIITSSFNLVSKPSSILVELADRRRLPARIVAADHSRMLTLLKVETSGLQPAQPVSKDDIRVGQWAIAVGRTYDSSFPNLSVGIVSAVNRIWGKAIQTDAKVSPVNYGGPLIDVRGRVLGVLVPLSPQGGSEMAGVEWYDSGIGFAVPLEDVYAVLPRLKRGEDLFPGLLGVTLKAEDRLTGQPVVDRVRYNSPAEKAGLQPGDRIVEIDGQPIERIADMRQALGTRLAGDQISLKVKRGEQTLELTATLVAKLEPYQAPYLGVLPARGASGTSGVRVRVVLPDSPAEKAGLRPGDVITQLDQVPVRDAAELWDVVSRCRAGQSVQLRVIRSAEGKPTRSLSVPVELQSVPNGIPARVPSEVIPPPKQRSEKVKTGEWLASEPSTQREYWAYVPDDYNPEYEYGLLVWIQPTSGDMQKEIMSLWKPVCQTRGWLLLAPRPARGQAWTSHDVPVIRKIIEHFMQQYSVDRNRIVVHGYSDGGPLACQLAFRHRDLVRGLLLAGSPVTGSVPENRPDYRLQFLLVCGEEDEAAMFVREGANVLRRMKYRCSLIQIKNAGRQYPPKSTVEQMARWLETIDAI